MTDAYDPTPPAPDEPNDHDHHAICRHCGVGINVRCDWTDEIEETSAENAVLAERVRVLTEALKSECRQRVEVDLAWRDRLYKQFDPAQRLIETTDLTRKRLAMSLIQAEFAARAVERERELRRK